MKALTPAQKALVGKWQPQIDRLMEALERHAFAGMPATIAEWAEILEAIEEQARRITQETVGEWHQL